MVSVNENTNPTAQENQALRNRSTWLTSEQIERIRDACLTDVFPTYLQGCTETIVTLLADTGLHLSELAVLDWDHGEFKTNPSELFLPGGLQKGAKRDAYLQS